MNIDKMFIKDTDSNESAIYTLPTAFCFRNKKGFTLFELIIAVTILAILTLTAIPLVQLSVKRQKEQRLRENLREIREAIKEFHRDTIGSPCVNNQQSEGGAGGAPNFSQGGGAGPQNPTSASVADPRTRVAICDPKIFTVDNPDKYPPTLETLVDGVNIIPRGADARLRGGAGLDGTKSVLESQDDATTKKIKVYLRKIPIDPMTGKDDWVFRSCYQDKDATDWDGINIFDVRSSSKETALNGEKYNEW